MKRPAVFSLTLLALSVPAHAATRCCSVTAIEARTGEYSDNRKPLK